MTAKRQRPKQKHTPRPGRIRLSDPQRRLLLEAAADPRTGGAVGIDTWHQQQVGLACERRGFGRVEEPSVRQAARFVISERGRRAAEAIRKPPPAT
jgi:hypothetical protein